MIVLSKIVLTIMFAWLSLGLWMFGSSFRDIHWVAPDDWFDWWMDVTFGYPIYAISYLIPIIPAAMAVLCFLSIFQ